MRLQPRPSVARPLLVMRGNLAVRSKRGPNSTRSNAERRDQKELNVLTRHDISVLNIISND